PPVTAADRAVLVAVVAACATASDQLGTPVAWPATDPLPTAAALPLLDDTRAAGYALVVVAAQSSGDQRAKALTTRTQLTAREAELVALAGTSAPPPPLGYALPFPVTDPDSAARLATLVLTSLVAGGLAPLTPLPAGSMAVVPLVRFLVDAAAIARTWGVGPVPFPGLVYP
ncbi:MAG: ferritin-like domain-containing protein, partial [Actinomycetota bacterium]|nr:ferritin-like domain-containing protein [Actinomycetota bacterium]